MGKEFTDQIEGAKSLAMLTKERGKMTQQTMDATECCKQYDVTAQNIEKLKSFTESEVIAETVFSEGDNCT